MRPTDGHWIPSVPIPEGMHHFSAGGTHIFDLESRPEFHPNNVRNNEEPLEPVRAIFRQYIQDKTGIDVRHLQYDPTIAITEAITNAMVHAHDGKFTGQPVRIILQIKHPVSPIPSQPKVLTVKVWDTGETGFPKDIHQRIGRQLKRVERTSQEYDQIKTSIAKHEAAIQQHKAELGTLTDTTKSHVRRRAQLERQIAQRSKWLQAQQVREMAYFDKQIENYGEPGKQNTATGLGAGLFLIKQMTRQTHYGQKWGRLEFSGLDEDCRPFRNEIHIKIPLIQLPIGTK